MTKFDTPPFGKVVLHERAPDNWLTLHGVELLHSFFCVREILLLYVLHMMLAFLFCESFGSVADDELNRSTAAQTINAHTINAHTHTPSTHLLELGTL